MSVQQQPKDLWGPETSKAVASFPVSGEPVKADTFADTLDTALDLRTIAAGSNARPTAV